MYLDLKKIELFVICGTQIGSEKRQRRVSIYKKVEYRAKV